MRGNIVAIQLSRISVVSILAGKGQGEQLQLRVDPPQERQRDIHHHQQRDHRQRQPHAHREQSRAQPNQRFGGCTPEDVCARRDLFQALREEAEDFAVQPHGEKQHPGHQLREHQQDAGIGFRIRVNRGGVGVSGLQPEHLRRQRERFQRDGHGNPDRNAHGRLGESPPGEHRHGDAVRPNHGPLAVKRQGESQRQGDRAPVRERS